MEARNHKTGRIPKSHTVGKLKQSKMKKVIQKPAFLIIVVAAMMFGCSSLNHYHTKGTTEYNNVTAKLLGEWEVTSFNNRGDEQIGLLYDKATVQFIEPENGGEWKTRFYFTIPKSIVDERIKKWNENEITVVVDEYIVVAELVFQISKKGELIVFENQSNYPLIKGSGEQLENFQGTETMFISSQSAMKQSGGLAGMAMARVTQSVTGTDFVPRIPSQVNYKDLTDTSTELVSIQKVNFSLKK